MTKFYPREDGFDLAVVETTTNGIEVRHDKADSPPSEAELNIIAADLGTNDLWVTTKVDPLPWVGFVRDGHVPHPADIPEVAPGKGTPWYRDKRVRR